MIEFPCMLCYITAITITNTVMRLPLKRWKETTNLTQLTDDCGNIMVSVSDTVFYFHNNDYHLLRKSVVKEITATSFSLFGTCYKEEVRLKLEDGQMIDYKLDKIFNSEARANDYVIWSIKKDISHIEWQIENAKRQIEQEEKRLKILLSFNCRKSTGTQQLKEKVTSQASDQKKTSYNSTVTPAVGDTVYYLEKRTFMTFRRSVVIGVAKEDEYDNRYRKKDDSPKKATLLLDNKEKKDVNELFKSLAEARAYAVRKIEKTIAQKNKDIRDYYKQQALLKGELDSMLPDENLPSDDNS